MKSYFTFLLPLICMILASCEMSHYKAVNATFFASGGIRTLKYVEEPLAQFAGTRTSQRADGSSATTDYQVSAQQFFQAVVGSVASWSSASVSKANLLFQRYQEGQITQREAQAQLLELKKAELLNSGQVVEPGNSVLNSGKILTAPKT